MMRRTYTYSYFSSAKPLPCHIKKWQNKTGPIQKLKARQIEIKNFYGFLSKSAQSLKLNLQNAVERKRCSILPLIISAQFILLMDGR